MSRVPRLNQKAPVFSAVDVFGAQINLGNYSDDYVLLVFLRYSGCPWCNLAIYRLSLEYPRLKAEKCQVIAFVQSDKKDVLENIYRRHDPKPQFPIIADYEMRFYKQFGVGLSGLSILSAITKIPYWLESVRKLGFKQKQLDGNFFLVPAWFLINNNTGKIVRSERGVSFYNHETFINIYDSLTFKD